MKKLIHHVWQPVLRTDKKDHKKCERCGLEKYYDFNWGKVIYVNPRTGIFTYHGTPECVLPNTKL